MKLEHFGMAEPGDCRLVFTLKFSRIDILTTLLPVSYYNMLSETMQHRCFDSLPNFALKESSKSQMHAQYSYLHYFRLLLV